MPSLVSIIMPIRNEEIFIKKCLNSILSQSYPKDKLEIIIIDGMSNDNTKKIINSFSKNFINLKLLENPQLTVPYGFNKGLSESNGDIIIRVDGHCELKNDYIKNCVEISNNTNYECVGGPIINFSKGIVGELINLAQSSFFGVGGVDFRKKIDSGKFVDTLAFGAYKRQVFAQLGGYDEELKRNQDDEFNFRLVQNGGRIWLDPSIVSTYYPRNSIAKLFSQYFQYGLYKIRVFQKRQSVASIRHLVPSIFVFSILGLLIYSFIVSSIPLSIFFIFYFTVSMSGSIYEYCSSNMKKNIINTASIILMPIIYFTLHFSYGLGMIFGMIKFANKWNDSKLKDLNFDKKQFKKKTLQ